MDKKERTLNAKNRPEASAVLSRSAVASALFDTGIGTPDGKTSRADERFVTAEVAGASGGTSSSWSPPFTRITPPAYTAPRFRTLRALVVPFGPDEKVAERLKPHDLRKFDVLAVRLKGGEHLSAAVEVAARSAGECDPMVIVDADLPVAARQDVDASRLRRFAVSVVPDKHASFVKYTLIEA
ncbi:MAG: hypothetical protein V4850_03745 [Myxococcota bacterium]